MQKFLNKTYAPVSRSPDIVISAAANATLTKPPQVPPKAALIE